MKFALNVFLTVALLCGAAHAAAAETLPDAGSAARYIADRMAESGVPGYAFAIVHGNEILRIGAHGVADPSGRAVTADTPFIIGSTTKSFTALCVMQLVEAGKLNLDRPAADYLPGFMAASTAGRAITLRMLLNQTSGLSHNAGDQPVWDTGETGRDAIRHWAVGLNDDALNRPVGHSYEYSNANYVVLGAVVEAVSGESYGDYLRAHVLRPLGMTHSFTSLDDGRRASLASGHRQWFGLFEASEVPFPPAFVPAGFLITSASDMGRYLLMIAGRGQIDGLRILSEASMAEMHRGAAPFDDSGKTSYAMGWVADTFNGIPVVYHDGDTGRFSSVMAMSRQDRFGVVVLSNGSGWLHGTHMIDAANGAINLLESRTPKSYATPYLMTRVMLVVIAGIPLLQLIFLLWSLVSFKAAKPRLVRRTMVPALLNVGLAIVFAYAVPQYFVGIPLIEFVLSIPDMGVAALLSVGVAMIWVLRLVGAFQSPASQPTERP
ncbi:MAG: serine hydrolase domain-containing protein [Micropepsaceae bacterium]